MTTQFRRGIALGATTLLIIALAGCAAAAPATSAGASTGRDADYAEEMTEAPAAYATQAVEGYGGGDADAPATGNQAIDNPLVAALPQDRMIIKNGEIVLLVKNTDTAIDQVTQVATDSGGYVLSSQADLTNDIKSATLTIAVRSDQFETAMRRLRQIAIKVMSELSTGEDVSSEFVDLESKLKNLEATRDRIRAFLDDAKTVDEALTINAQLSEVEAEIETVKGRMNYLSGRSAYSTITVQLEQEIALTPTPTPTATPTPTPTPIWSLGPTIEKAANAQVNLVRGLLEVLVWLVFVPGPYALVGVLSVWGFRVWFRRRNGSPPPPSEPTP